MPVGKQERQMTRLKEVRDSKTPADLIACYSPKDKKSIEDVDKLVANSGALAAAPKTCFSTSFAMCLLRHRKTTAGRGRQSAL